MKRKNILNQIDDKIESLNFLIGPTPKNIT